MKLFGFDLAKDDEPLDLHAFPMRFPYVSARPWQFVITFKLPGENAPDELRKVFEEDVMETSRKWQDFRTVEPFLQLIRPLWAFERVV